MSKIVFLQLTLANKTKANINVSDIVEIRQYSGQVLTWKTERNEEFGEAPYKSVPGEPEFITNGAIIHMRNSPLEWIVLESHDKIAKMMMGVADFVKSSS